MISIVYLFQSLSATATLDATIHKFMIYIYIFCQIDLKRYIFDDMLSYQDLATPIFHIISPWINGRDLTTLMMIIMWRHFTSSSSVCFLQYFKERYDAISFAKDDDDTFELHTHTPTTGKACNK